MSARARWAAGAGIGLVTWAIATPVLAQTCSGDTAAAGTTAGSCCCSNLAAIANGVRAMLHADACTRTPLAKREQALATFVAEAQRYAPADGRPGCSHMEGGVTNVEGTSTLRRIAGCAAGNNYAHVVRLANEALSVCGEASHSWIVVLDDRQRERVVSGDPVPPGGGKACGPIEVVLRGDIRVDVAVAVQPQVAAEVGLGLSSMNVLRPGLGHLANAEIPGTLSSGGPGVGAGATVYPFRILAQEQASEAAEADRVHEARRMASAAAAHARAEQVRELVVEHMTRAMADAARGHRDATAVRAEGRRVLETASNGSKGALRTALDAAPTDEDGLVRVWNVGLPPAGTVATTGAEVRAALDGVGRHDLLADVAARVAATDGDVAEAVGAALESAADDDPLRLAVRKALEPGGLFATQIARHALSEARQGPGLTDPSRPSVVLAEIVRHLSGLGVSIATSTGASTVDALRQANAKFSIATTFDVVNPDDPYLSRSLLDCYARAARSVEAIARSERAHPTPGLDASTTLSSAVVDRVRRCRRPGGRSVLAIGSSFDFVNDADGRPQLEGARPLWLALEARWDHAALTGLGAIGVLHSVSANPGKDFDRSAALQAGGFLGGRASLFGGPGSVSAEVAIAGDRAATGAGAEERVDVAAVGSLGMSASLALPLGLSLNASARGSVSSLDGRSEGRAIAGIGWAQVPEPVRTALRAAGVALR